MHEEIQAPSAPQSDVIVCGPDSRASLAYQGAKNQVDIVKDQLGDQRNVRDRITRELVNDQTQGTDRAGLEARLKTVDARIAELDKALAAAQSQQSTAAGMPCAIYERPNVPDHSLKADDVAGVSAAIFTALAFPLMVAYARRIWRRSAKVTVALPPEVAARMQAMEEAIESIAIEVERVGEGQRFMTQALTDTPRGIGAGAAEPILIRPRESVHADRPL